MSNENLKTCINCERPESVIPLVSITFAQNPTWICTQCLPTLIHNPDKLADKFSNMNTEEPPPPAN
ncbi:MAG: hypothetical protein L3J41_10985 [Melioribacteraceae bacterium]|nr:hypothetical protein [Melioribacteraceae bacterium]